MKKNSSRKIAITIAIIILVIVEIIAFGISRAKNVKNIVAKVSDKDGLLSVQNVDMVATDEGESGYFIVLPETINNKLITSYEVTVKEIVESSSTDDTLSGNEIENTTTEEKTSIVTKEPGDTVYLTEDEIENLSIEITATFDKKEINSENLYNQKLECELSDTETISLTSYMDDGTILDVNTDNMEDAKTLITNEGIDESCIKNIYNINVLKNEENYELKDSATIQIPNINSDNIYKVYLINENNEINEILNTNINDDTLEITTQQLGTFAILEYESVIVEPNLMMSAAALEAPLTSTAATVEIVPVTVNGGETWDGTVSTSFKYGSGTESNPYLITNGDDLAYLASQVNNGTTYEGVYFQQTNDINLNNLAWTPIGTISNSFRGIYDGAGRTISNVDITISTSATSSVVSYGVFGSIGGGSTYCTIKNVEFNAVNIDLTASPTIKSNSAGYKIGSVTGVMYNHSQIVNVAVKNSTITSSGTISARYTVAFTSTTYYSPIVFVGGIAGDAVNTSSSETDPGDGARAIISNCYSDVDIGIEVKASKSGIGSASSTMRCFAQVNIGGIIGRIKSQNIWPTTCLYTGTISASNKNGLVGPIFGADRNNTDYSSTTNMNTYWNGDNKSSLTMNSYYTAYSVYGNTFTSTVQSGNAGTNTTYRRSTSSSNIGYVQGVNKGIYLSNKSTMVTTFNNNLQSGYMTWAYKDGDICLLERLTADIETGDNYDYQITIDDNYNVGTYQYKWYVNGTEDTSVTGSSFSVLANYEQDKNIVALVYDGQYYTTVKFIVPRLSIEIDVTINTSTNTATGTLTGTAIDLISLSDYTYQWYETDPFDGTETAISGETTLTYSNLESGKDYKIVATNHTISQLSAQYSFSYGDRTVIYVSYSSGNDSNNGFSPSTPVKNLSAAYGKASSTGTRDTNIIVMMGSYNNSSLSFYNSQNSTTYNKNVTITGKYGGTDYSANWRFGASSSFRYLCGDTTFRDLTFSGNNGSMYLICQGHSVTFGKNVKMTGYATANSNQGLLGSNAPAFHIFAGWYQYNKTTLPNNNSQIIINSGAYGRVILGSTPGTSDGIGKTTSHDFTGSSMSDAFNVSLLVDIENSTKGSYAYDINLLVGGSACGNNYSIVTENIKAGSIGRLLGGSIGDSSELPGWDYPENTFLGRTTINISGGTINELYGGCLGRNMDVVGSSSATGNTCESYFYGTITLNMTGGTITNNVYGAGAGGVTGYNANSSDPYKSYGQNLGFGTTVTLNISGGTIGGNIFGGGYGYTEYLNENVTATDGGALYGNSYINISGSPTISGNIYGAGCGYNYSNKTEIAQMIGDSYITIEGSPTISGKIFGAGAGISGKENMAKLTGTSTITIAANLGVEVYGGGNIAKTSGTSNVNITSGNHTGNIYGGGNLGIIDGTAKVTISGGSSSNVFGGGNQATVTNTIVRINGGTNEVVYGGGNNASTNETTVYISGGTTQTVFGGGNEGTVTSTEIIGNDGTATTIYGGGNNADVEDTTVTISKIVSTTLYGGGNEGKVTDKAIVDISGGSIGTAYGGGNKASVATTEVSVSGSSSVLDYVYGGGNQGTVTTTTVEVSDGTETNVFGGGNNATVETTNVTISGGTISNLYGGGNQAGTTTTNVTINNGRVINSYGGGNYGAVTTTNVKIYGGTLDFSYGGGNSADASTTKTTAYGGTIGSIFGGSNQTGIVSTSYVTTTQQTTLNITDLYGGNNAGGKTSGTILVINGGTITNLYGGGNQALTVSTNTTINSGTITNVYGGGNAAAISQGTILNINGANISNNVYGGGNEGTVATNTQVVLSGANIQGSAYAGGNGVTAIVYGNTNIIVENGTVIGSTTSVAPASGSVFGGGNAAATGAPATNASTSTVNIIGGTIYGNIYGGANTSVVYGEVFVNIGKDTINTAGLQSSDIYIKGTIFGGGEANAEGSEEYDFDFISVTKAITININGNGHSSFRANGSIFGSGNASSTSGTSIVNIKNYGTYSNPQNNISIQRANTVTLDNSCITLIGATDRCNDYSNVLFTLSRIDELKLKNSSCLYLNCGANLLKKLSSLVDIDGVETKSTVTIGEDSITKNTDNRIYMLEGKNLNIATNQAATLYGDVEGMTFFGLFSNATNPTGSTGLYNYTIDDGDEVTNAGTFSYNSYVKASHKTNHDLEVDGFYTNINDEGTINVEYVEASPENDVYYIWLVGEALEITQYEVEMIGSKYATLGTSELPLTGFSVANTKFILSGLSLGLESGINLVDKTQIKSIETNESIANSNFGLSVQTSRNGWQTNSKTSFYSANGGQINGDVAFNMNNSATTPTLLLCFYHAQNLSLAQNLGTVRIRYQVLIPIDDLNYEIQYADIVISLSTALYQDNYYEAAISPGEEFELFTTTETSITTSSTFSTYYSLYIPEFSEDEHFEYFSTYKRALVSLNSSNQGFVFPENTKITMIDLANNQYYYYVVTSSDETNNKYVYYFEDFIQMGSTNDEYDESVANSLYYNSDDDFIYENFIFHVDFSQAEINSNSTDNSLLIELRDTNDETLIGVLGIERDSVKYSLFANSDAVIDVEETVQPSTIYLGKTFNLNLNIEYTQSVLGSATVYDTRAFDYKMGIKISVYDSNNNRLNLDSLLGVSFLLNGVRYYPRIDGTTRIKVADRVTDISAKITVDTGNNSTLASDNYKIKVETFSSADGVYYGLSSSSNDEATLKVINEAYGLKVSTQNEAKIIDKTTGKLTDGSKTINANIAYNSGFSNPKIVVALYRRDYDTQYSLNYNLVDLKDYFDTEMTAFKTNEYIVSNSPGSSMLNSLTTKENLQTGTYKLVYKLYDRDSYIGEAYEYFVVK